MIKNFTHFINDIYNRKKSKNHSYSKRAFARDLGLSSSYTSDLMSGHRNISIDTAANISRKLGLDAIEHEYLMSLVQLTQTENLQLQDEISEKISLLHFRKNNIKKIK